ncbi:MAG: heme ABC exporter ATP-binding protein CcmA [Gammaproteobacteria bacterium]|nr:heme ABC exporter ATP-binding protein CcmA [Gammaproteobacteria bacterium]
MAIKLQLNNLSCFYDDIQLFKPVDLTLRKGEICRVMGPNGAGKTTLLRSVGGLFRGYNGKVMLSDEASRIHYLGHRAGIRDELTCIENLQFLTQYSLTRTSIDSALERVGLIGYEQAFPDELSAGQRRRLLLATLFCMQFDILLLDEPFTALDVDGVALIAAQLKNIAEQGCIVLYSTHHADAVLTPNKTVMLEVSQ